MKVLPRPDQALSGTAPRHGARRPSRPEKAKFKPQLEALEDRCLMSADMVFQWNAIAIEAARRDHALGARMLQNGPTRTSRALAIVQAAVFDAVNSIDPLYSPYLIANRQRIANLFPPAHRSATAGASRQGAAPFCGAYPLPSRPPPLPALTG